MIYSGSTQRHILAFYLMIILSTIPMNNFSSWVLLFQILISVLLVGAMGIKYQLEINEGNMTYRIFFLKRVLYTKKIDSNKIIKIKLKRIGWATKGAALLVKNGFNIQIAHFEPNTIWTELLAFAHKQDIPIEKTKDFLLLEK